LTQQQLADSTGLSPATIGRLERHAQPNCRTRTMARIAIALGEHPATFTRWVTFTPPAPTDDQAQAAAKARPDVRIRP
jgi:transcriptional regulator with XRE-family HTH domain